MLGKCISGIRISKILLGEDPDPAHGLRNFGARRVGLHTTLSAPPQAKNPSYAPGYALYKFTFYLLLYLLTKKNYNQFCSAVLQSTASNCNNIASK